MVRYSHQCLPLGLLLRSLSVLDIGCYQSLESLALHSLQGKVRRAPCGFRAAASVTALARCRSLASVLLPWAAASLSALGAVSSSPHAGWVPHLLGFHQIELIDAFTVLICTCARRLSSSCSSPNTVIQESF